MRNSSAIIDLGAMAGGDARRADAARSGADDEEIDVETHGPVSLLARDRAASVHQNS